MVTSSLYDKVNYYLILFMILDVLNVSVLSLIIPFSSFFFSIILI